MAGIEDFSVIPDDAEEEILGGQTPEQTVCSIAMQKAVNVSLKCSADDLIIAADTLVFLDGRPISKPVDKDDAKKMLRSLSGRRHTVYTGVAILKGTMKSVYAEKSNVFFRELSDSEITSYVETGEPMDKAGAYGAQGRGAVFIERIEGDFFNVMGLPLCRLFIMLKEFGVIV